MDNTTFQAIMEWCGAENQLKGVTYADPPQSKTFTDPWTGKTTTLTTDPSYYAKYGCLLAIRNENDKIKDINDNPATGFEVCAQYYDGKNFANAYIPLGYNMYTDQVSEIPSVHFCREINNDWKNNNGVIRNFCEGQVDIVKQKYPDINIQNIKTGTPVDSVVDACVVAVVSNENGYYSCRDKLNLDSKISDDICDTFANNFKEKYPYLYEYHHPSS